MILQLNNLEMGTLMLHMAMMRQNVRNGFKSNYGKAQGKEMLKSYDEVKNAMESNISVKEDMAEEEMVKESFTFQDLHFNIQEIIMLSSFMDFYLPKLTETLEAAGKVSAEDQLQLDSLESIRIKVEELKTVHKVG